MNAKLAKELKDAGFPQNYLCQHHEPECCQHDYLRDKDTPYHPTLPELIDACGEDIHLIERIHPSQRSDGNEWVVTGKCVSYSDPRGNYESKGNLIFADKYIDVAVAELYKALNKKT